MSHSSDQKLLVKALKNLLPERLQYWIDEYEIPLGGQIEETIRKAIIEDCDLLLLFIDKESIKSDWVKFEYNLALEKESRLNRVFVLPIVYKKESWNALDHDQIRGRKYIECPNFEDRTLQMVADKISSELFSLLVESFDRKESKDRVGMDGAIAKIKNAQALASQFSVSLKTIIFPHRKNNPISISGVTKQLSIIESSETFTEESTVQLIYNLINQGLLKGIWFNGDIAYLNEERVGEKSILYTEMKAMIAEHALSLISSNQTIFIDGGSTTLKLAKLLSVELRSMNLTGLNILTNSIPVAAEILETLSGLGLGDQNAICNVYQSGGRLRPTSLTAIPFKEHSPMEELIAVVGKADIAFVGANGVYGDFGFANKNEFEIPSKRLMIKNSRRKIILVDPSKFKIHQPTEFVRFSEGLEIITCFDVTYEDKIQYFSDIINDTNSILTILRPSS